MKSKQERPKRNTEKKSKGDILIDGWCLHNQLMDEYTFMRKLPKTLTSGSGYDLSKARLIVYHNH